MAKRKSKKSSSARKVTRSKPIIAYNSLTFLVFLAFVLAVSFLLVAKIL